ncbi:MAG: gluconate 2-dehydrogenase subunit 3 family protein [Acidobacteriota bacterium]|nr:gluconate 2-dehydrogenase subunit 3 family protein [Acidobacteriota bacterium]
MMEHKPAETPRDAANDQPKRSGMNRRDMVRRLATAMTAGTAMAAVPGVAAAHPVYKHLMSESTREQADAKAADKDWSPAFFDPHQNETFIVLAERIIPGSDEAQVNRFVDLLLSVDSLEAQKAFLNSLSAFEAYSLQNYQRPFKDLTEDEQNHVLTVASTAEPGGKLSNFRRRHILGPEHAGNEEPERLTLRDHFENIKHWVSGAYFSSEPGMKSLGWTGQVMWTSFPGCKHSEGHA